MLSTPRRPARFASALCIVTTRLSALLLACGLASAAARSGDEPRPGNVPGVTTLVTVQEDGSLLYRPYSIEGDTLPDFSHCGYAAGESAPPDAPVRETLTPEPGEGDDFARIQAAIDRVARHEPDARGIRGAVLLKRGVYRCSDSLRIETGGIVLRGAGDGEEGTVIRATARKQEPLVIIGARGTLTEDTRRSVEISDAYVPVGARSLPAVFPSRKPTGSPSARRCTSSVAETAPGSARSAWMRSSRARRIPPTRGNGSRLT